jgi:hypothetical protein
MKEESKQTSPKKPASPPQPDIKEVNITHHHHFVYVPFYKPPGVPANYTPPILSYAIDPLEGHIPIIPPPPIPHPCDLFGIGAPIQAVGDKETTVNQNLEFGMSIDANIHSEANHKEMVEAHLNQISESMMADEEPEKKKSTVSSKMTDMLTEKEHANTLNREIDNKLGD